MGSTRFIRAACVAVVLLAGSACAGDEEPVAADSAVVDGDDVEPEEPNPPVESPEEPEDEAVGASWSDETDPVERLRGCLVGTFVMDRDAWSAGIADVMRGDMSDVRVESTGDIGVAFTRAGGYTVTGRRSRTVSRGVSQGGTLEWVLRFDGAEHGSWTLSGDQLSMEAGAAGRLAGEHALSMDGQPLPDDAFPVDGTPWSETLTATCDAETFTARPTDDPAAPEVVFRRDE